MRLGKGVEAAIHCTALLAELGEGATVSSSALAEQFGLSASYLLKHLKELVAAGILESAPGPAGGYRLARPATDISLLDIVLAVEGRGPAFNCCEIRQRGPVEAPAGAFRRPCQINAAMQRAERSYLKALAAEHIAGIVRSYLADTDTGFAAARRASLQPSFPPSTSKETKEKK